MAHNRIKELRNKKGLSQKEFAKAFSDFIKNDESIRPVSYATISRWERGENEPKLQTWRKLADFFDVPVSYLQGISDIQNSVDEWKVEDLKHSGQKAEWLEKDAEELLKIYSSVSAKSLTYHQLETIATLTKRFNSLVGSLAEYNSYKTLETLKNVIATLGIITAQYRVLSDDPDSFEKRVIPVINEFLFALKKLE
jgi:transcriptional regulator with XRE-family HTH domain